MIVLAALVALAVAPSQSWAGTWYITPTITNNTGSTADTCPGHADYVGCMILETSGVIDGDWIAAPPSTGGRHELPANPTDNVDTPEFDAPHFAEGADGYFGYTMPDGSQFSLVAEDDQGLVDAFNQAYPGCGVPQGQGPGDYTCLAAYPGGTVGDPSSSDFRPWFTFYPNEAGAAPYTAAGQVCTTTTGSARCAAGLKCSYAKPIGCGGTVNDGEPGQWSPTDPNNFMWLNFVNLSDNPITITDLYTCCGGTGPNGQLQCTVHNEGDTCSIQTSGGCALDTIWCGSDAIEMSVGNGESDGSVMVMQQAEIPASMGEHWEAEWASAIESAIAYALAGVPAPAEGDAVTGRPQITKLRASAGSAAAAAARAGKQRAVRVSYRNNRTARSVLTLARGRPGVRRGGRCVARSRQAHGAGERCTRWVNLPRVRTRSSSDTYWTPRGDRPCPAAARRGQREGGRCHLRRTLSGHRRHRDLAGLNQMRLSRVGGRRLAPGRYRATVVALAGPFESRPASATFRIRSTR